MFKRSIKNIEKKISELHNSTEIMLWLQSYDDLFSDFDPRQYYQKALSDDFLIEIKKASYEKTVVTNLKLLIPKHTRNKDEEAIIVDRLRDHFNKHYIIMKKERDEIVREGTIFIICGIIVNVLKTTISVKKTEEVYAQFMISLIDPVAWFFFWEGLNRIIFDSKSKKDVLEFYKKMSKSEITFIAY